MYKYGDQDYATFWSVLRDISQGAVEHNSGTLPLQVGETTLEAVRFYQTALAIQAAIAQELFKQAPTRRDHRDFLARVTRSDAALDDVQTVRDRLDKRLAWSSKGSLEYDAVRIIHNLADARVALVSGPLDFWYATRVSAVTYAIDRFIQHHLESYDVQSAAEALFGGRNG